MLFGRFLACNEAHHYTIMTWTAWQEFCWDFLHRCIWNILLYFSKRHSSRNVLLIYMCQHTFPTLTWIWLHMDIHMCYISPTLALLFSHGHPQFPRFIQEVCLIQALSWYLLLCLWLNSYKTTWLLWFRLMLDILPFHWFLLCT